MFLLNIKITQKGLSLIELLLVVGLAAIILTGGLMTFNRISDSNKITEETKFISILIAESALYSKNSRSSSFDNKILSQLKVLANSLQSNGLIKSNLSSGIRVNSIYNNQDKLITHVKFEFVNFQGEYCTRFIQAIETQTDLISVEKRILKNQFDKNNLKTYSLEDTAHACDSLTKQYGTFPINIIIPYA